MNEVADGCRASRWASHDTLFALNRSRPVPRIINTVVHKRFYGKLYKDVSRLGEAHNGVPTVSVYFVRRLKGRHHNYYAARHGE